MTRERWGAFSVIDHKRAPSLIPELILYDRLVVPVPAYGDRERWIRNDWDPDLLDRRLERLGELAIKAVWTSERRRRFRDELAKLEPIQSDASDIAAESRRELPYVATRRALAQEPAPRLEEGAADPVVVAAYQSIAALRSHLGVVDAGSTEDVALAISHRVAVPFVERHPESALGIVLDLAKDAEFRAKRAHLYELQDAIAQPGTMKTEADLLNLQEEAEDFEKFVRQAITPIRARGRYAFTFTAQWPGLGTGIPFGGVSSRWSAVRRFRYTGAGSLVGRGQGPVAMSHSRASDAETRSRGLAGTR